VRSSVGIVAEQVKAARREDDLNVLSISADFVDEENAKRMVQMFLGTPFSEEEKHKRRLDKIAELEQKGS
jgi:ribose 5-phosphate isomerase B